MLLLCAVAFALVALAAWLKPDPSLAAEEDVTISFSRQPDYRQADVDRLAAELRASGGAAIVGMVDRVRRHKLSALALPGALRFSRMGPLVAVKITDLLSDPDAGVRLATVRAIASLPHKLEPVSSQVLGRLIPLLHDPQTEVRVGALLAIDCFKTQTPESVSSLMKLVEENEWNRSTDAIFIRQNAAFTLSHSGPPARDVVPRLAAILTHTNTPAEPEVARTLARILTADRVSIAEVESVGGVADRPSPAGSGTR